MAAEESQSKQAKWTEIIEEGTRRVCEPIIMSSMMSTVSFQQLLSRVRERNSYSRECSIVIKTGMFYNQHWNAVASLFFPFFFFLRHLFRRQCRRLLLDSNENCVRNCASALELACIRCEITNRIAPAIREHIGRAGMFIAPGASCPCATKTYSLVNDGEPITHPRVKTV